MSGKQTVHLIWAQARNGVIGSDQGIPWHLPEDLAHFRRLTRGSAVIMGRLTWDSLPESVRPLPGRTNIVLTRDPSWSRPGAATAASLDEALALAGDSVFIIGGGEIYRQAVPLASRAYITVVDTAPDGDTTAPGLDGWTAQRGPWQQSAGGLNYRFEEHTPAA